jgi:hypothetical protein
MRLAPLLLLVAGCSSAWPPAGQGGMAETRWPAPLATPLIDPAGPDGIEDRMRCGFERLSATEAAARARGTHTGAINLLELTANRARREFTGGFHRDLALTLDRLDTEIDRLRGSLALPLARGCA